MLWVITVGVCTPNHTKFCRRISLSGVSNHIFQSEPSSVWDRREGKEWKENLHIFSSIRVSSSNDLWTARSSLYCYALSGLSNIGDSRYVCLHFHKKLTVKISLNIDFKVVNVDLAVEVNFTCASLHLCIGYIANSKASQEVKSSILKDYQVTPPHTNYQVSSTPYRYSTIT